MSARTAEPLDTVWELLAFLLTAVTFLLVVLAGELPANRWTQALRQPWCPGDGRAAWPIPGAAWPLVLAG